MKTQFWLGLAFCLGTWAAGSARADQVNVKDFGAVGDGVADDTTAIQQAIDGIAGGGAVLFPAGAYKVTRTLQDGGNLKRAGPFEATPDATLVLVSDGSNWLELSRSKNRWTAPRF